MNQRSLAEGKSKGQKSIAQGNAWVGYRMLQFEWINMKIVTFCIFL